jgi:phage terminase large subunit-like protein
MMKKAGYSERAHQYCCDVVSGRIVSSKWIKLAAQRHLDDLRRTASRWEYNAAKADKVCAFIEALPFPNGKPFLMPPWQVWLTCSLMGWMDEAGTRKYIEALILVAKGNGKSPWASALSLWFAFFDGKEKAECYTGATSLAQALEVFNPARDFVEAQPAFKRMGISALKKSIFSRTGSRFVPVISRGKHGARPYLAVLDELHQALSSDLYGTFRTGCNKVPNSLLLTISTAGVASTENPCYQLQGKAQKVLDGSLPDDRFFAALYCADESVEWSSEEALRMANPNLGISNDAEKIRLAIASALRNPGEQNNTKAMHLNIWSTAASTWISMVSFNACADTELNIDNFAGETCWIGVDTASKLDLASISIVFKRDVDGKTHYYAFSRNYLPERQVNLPENTHYQRWVKQGHLTATDGSAIDFAKLEADLIDLIHKFNVEQLCFDPAHGGMGLVQRVVAETNVTSQETPQRPLQISPAMKVVEAEVADGRFHFDGDPVMSWCFSNIVTTEGANSLYRMPEKERPENKIDTAMAVFFAVSRAMLIPSEPNRTWTAEVW